MRRGFLLGLVVLFFSHQDVLWVVVVSAAAGISSSNQYHSTLHSARKAPPQLISAQSFGAPITSIHFFAFFVSSTARKLQLEITVLHVKAAFVRDQRNDVGMPRH